MPEKYGYETRPDFEPQGDTGTMIDPRSRQNLPASMGSTEERKRAGGGGWVDDFMTSVLRDQPHSCWPFSLRPSTVYNSHISVASWAQDISLSRLDVADFALQASLVPNQDYIALDESGGNASQCWQSRDPVASDGLDAANFNSNIGAFNGTKGMSIELVMHWRTHPP